MMHEDLVQRLHAAPLRGVLAITGGGSGALERLLSVPGASGTVLEAVVPYSAAALADWLGASPDRACDEATARRMATRAFERTRELDPQAPAAPWFGLGATASLATDRPKRGEHRAHLAVQTVSRTLVVSLAFEKGRRTRAEEEAVVAHAIVAALADAAGVHRLDLSRTPPGMEAAVIDVAAPPEWSDLLAGLRNVVAVAGAPEPGAEAVCLVPGSFNPLHAGHAELAAFAARRTGRPAVFELSIANVDKPPLDFIDLQRRVEALSGKPLWITCAPTFVKKARLAPGSVFAVGADTIERIGEGRYYTDTVARDAALEELAALGCRFLVFGRQCGKDFQTLGDLSLPPALRALCEGVNEEEFRVDVCSTDLRGEPPH